MSKLLDDAKAAGFGVFQGEIYANISYKENDDNRVITKNLAKFASLQTDKNPSSWDCYDIDITNLETDIKQFCLDNARLAPLFFTLYKALQQPQWISVKDGFPAYGQKIIGAARHGATWIETFDSDEPEGDMVYWMPLLSPPTNTEDI